MATKDIIIRIESRVDQLITDHQRLSDLCQTLRVERDSLLQERRALQERVKGLEHQLSILQLCDGLGSSAVSREQARARARARVNRLMREVDNCINLLSAETQVGEKVDESNGDESNGGE